jgi:hypothetical protein
LIKKREEIKNEIWKQITKYLKNCKKLNLLSLLSSSQIFEIIEITNDHLVIKFQKSKGNLKIEKSRFLSACKMLDESKGNWVAIGASRIKTKPNTLEGRIKMDYNGNLDGLSTTSWIAAILVKVFDNIKFNNKMKGQALKML